MRRGYLWAQGAPRVACAPLWAAAPVELGVPQGVRGGATTGVTGGAAVSVLRCVARVDTAVVRRHVALFFCPSMNALAAGKTLANTKNAHLTPSTRRLHNVKPHLLPKTLGHAVPGREAHVQRRERVGQLIDVQRIVVDVELY